MLPVHRNPALCILLLLGCGAGFRAPLAAQEAELAQWRNSPHARSMDSMADRLSMNQPGCAHCHTAEGYLQVTLGGGESGAPYENASGLICRTCHLTGEGGVGVAGLRAGGPEETCRGCHAELVASTPEDLSWCAQDGLFRGTGGAEIPGHMYPNSTHAEIEKGCVGCHMAGAGRGLDGTRVGGHTFWVKTKGDGPTLFNPAPCVPCHGTVTPEGMSLNQREVENLLEALADLLPQKPAADDSTLTEPRYPADPTLSDIEARASFNYWLVRKDGTLGVHNPRYTRALLRASLGELRER